MTSTMVVLGERITFEGGSSANLSSNVKSSTSTSNNELSMMVTSNECWRFASSKVRNTSRFSAIISWKSLPPANNF